MITLLDSGWQFREMERPDGASASSVPDRDGSSSSSVPRGLHQWRPCSVPGSIHTDLLSAGLIGDPFWRKCETELQWIDHKDWEYRLIFDLPEEVMGMNHNLLFEGLDTWAEVLLNGVPILSADNMYRGWEVSTAPMGTELLRDTGNELLVRFTAPVNHDLPAARALGFNYPAANDLSELGGLGDTKVSVFSRKSPYMYGWDWGPRFIGCGIWRPVRLESWQGARVKELFLEQLEVGRDRARVRIHATVEACGAKDLSALCEASVCMSSPRVDEESAGSCARIVHLAAGINEVDLEMTIDNPRLWWCRGQGRQELYTFVFSLLDSESSVPIDSRSAKTGLRTVRLVREGDEWGTSFYIELNGRPVFMKGGNHIPNDNFPARVDKAAYRREIESCVEANFNAIRVWGGGFYENDFFYDLCDEAGLLVWQEFMFACSMYPGDRAYLDSVEAEARYNIRRLRNHPSVALWCGNNEIDSAWVQYRDQGGWGWKNRLSAEVREKMWKAYEEIFDRILPDILGTELPGASWWPSSPQVDLSKTAFRHSSRDAKSGDMHYWGVWHQREPFENYHEVVGRFMSEYGFQSFPEMKTLRAFCEEGDLDIDSEVMKAHQKSPIGNRAILDYLERELPMPVDFADFVYLSQLIQGIGIRTAIEAHRLRRPFCMGSLVWQINDCWPCPSWSSIDYYGNWKALHYWLCDAFADIALAVKPSESEDGSGPELQVSVLNNLPNQEALSLGISVMRLSGELLSSQCIQSNIPAASVRLIARIGKDSLKGADPYDAVVVLNLRRGTELLLRRTTKALNLPAPEVKIKTSRTKAGWTVSIEAGSFVRALALTTEADGHFHNNWFDLLPGERREVEFRSASDVVPRIEWKSVMPHSKPVTGEGNF